MAKVLRVEEVIELIEQAATTSLLPENERSDFLEKLGILVGETFGAEFSSLQEETELPPPAPLPIKTLDPNDDSGHTFCFHWSEKTPEDMGVFGHYDRDITLAEWKAGG